MNILAGKFKSRNITVPLGIRPVSLRVKKACFDILKGEIEGKKVLDLFAGSGSLGIEAFSRGASEATFVDSNRNCIKAVKKNILSLNIGPCAKVYLKDSFSAIKDLSTYRKSFDLIFLDPPYYQGMVRKALQALSEYDILTSHGYITAFCYQKDDIADESHDFSLIVNRKYGQTTVLIYKK